MTWQHGSTCGAWTSSSLGSGIHACPGTELAVTIAAAGIEELIASGIDFQQLVETVSYRHSFNTCIPVLAKTIANGCNNWSLQ
jgi:cytochrome P450